MLIFNTFRLFYLRFEIKQLVFTTRRNRCFRSYYTTACISLRHIIIMVYIATILADCARLLTNRLGFFDT